MTPERCEREPLCDYCAHQPGVSVTRMVYGWRCKEGLRQQAEHYNTFFRWPDGAPFIQIGNVDEWVAEQIAAQDAMGDWPHELPS